MSQYPNIHAPQRHTPQLHVLIISLELVRFKIPSCTFSDRILLLCKVSTVIVVSVVFMRHMNRQMEEQKEWFLYTSKNFICGILKNNNCKFWLLSAKIINTCERLTYLHWVRLIFWDTLKCLSINTVKSYDKPGFLGKGRWAENNSNWTFVTIHGHLKQHTTRPWESEIVQVHVLSVNVLSWFATQVHPVI